VDYNVRMLGSIAFTNYFLVGMAGMMGTILMATMGDLSIELNNTLKKTDAETRA
jgi:hypothetical protein